jgi:hypothetical protein
MSTRKLPLHAENIGVEAQALSVKLEKKSPIQERLFELHCNNHTKGSL